MLNHIPPPRELNRALDDILDWTDRLAGDDSAQALAQRHDLQHRVDQAVGLNPDHFPRGLEAIAGMRMGLMLAQTGNGTFELADPMSDEEIVASGILKQPGIKVKEADLGRIPLLAYVVMKSYETPAPAAASANGATPAKRKGRMAKAPKHMSETVHEEAGTAPVSYEHDAEVLARVFLDLPGSDETTVVERVFTSLLNGQHLPEGVTRGQVENVITRVIKRVQST